MSITNSITVLGLNPPSIQHHSCNIASYFSVFFLLKIEKKKKLRPRAIFGQLQKHFTIVSKGSKKEKRLIAGLKRGGDQFRSPKETKTNAKEIIKHGS